MYSKKSLLLICVGVCFIVVMIFMYTYAYMPYPLRKADSSPKTEVAPSHSGPSRVQDCLEGSVTVKPGGRLANAIFEYASMWAVARIFGLRPFTPQEILKRLGGIYKPLSAPPIQTLLDEAERLCNVSLTEGDVMKLAITPGKQDPLTWVATARNKRELLVLWSGIVSAQAVVLVRDQLRQELQFTDKLLQSSRKSFEKVKQEISHNVNVSITFVGIHVRRTDYSAYVKRKYGVKPADENYFRRAAEVMLRRLRADGVSTHVAFLVVSDDPPWCKSKLMPLLSSIQIPEARNHSAHFVGQGGQSQPGHDMALLCQCSHSIRAYGTFSMWSALMAGGRTIVYNTTKDGPLAFLPHLPNWETI